MSRIEDHYTVDGLGDRILAALHAAGSDLAALQVDDLAPVDEFHIRGRAATEELASWAGVHAGQELLDVGSGLGGTARYLASRTGCSVTGIDLTAEYCRVAEMLSARVGLSDRTSFRVGSALELPFDDARFDVVWTEHVQMNVADKAAFYGELARVLRPGGLLAFHDIFAGPEGMEGFRYPVPWAASPEINHLLAVPELRELLSGAGLAVERWADCTREAIDFFRPVLQRVREQGWPPVGLHLVVKDAEASFPNLLDNLQHGRAQVAQAVLRKAER